MIKTVEFTKIYGNDDTAFLKPLGEAARTALRLRTSSDLASIVNGYTEALRLLKRDALGRGYYCISDGAVENFINKHPISCLYGERIATLTQAGGLGNVNNTSLSDVYSDSVEAVENMVKGERIRWYVPGCIECGTPEWTAHFTINCES